MQKILAYLSLKQRLLLIILIVSTVSVTMVSLALNYIHYNSVKKQLVNELQIASDLVINNISAALAFNDQQRIEEVLASIKGNENVIYACIYNEHNKIEGQFINNSEKAQCPESISSATNTLQSSSKNVIVIKDIYEGESYLGKFYMEADLKNLFQIVKYNTLYSAFLVLLVLVVIAYPLANLMQSSVSQPIYRLVDTTKKLSLSPPEKEDVYSEVQLITYALEQSHYNLVEAREKLEEMNYRQMAMMVNELLAMRLILSEAKTNRMASETLSKATEGEFLENIDEYYKEIAAINKGIAQKFEQNVFELAHNMSVQGSMMKEDKKYVDLGSLVKKAHQSVLSASNIALDLSGLSRGKDNSYVVYEKALTAMIEHTMLFFKAIVKNDLEYTIKTIVNFTGGATRLSFVCKPVTVQKGVEYFDFENEDLEIRLLNCKFFHNINAAQMDRNFYIEVSEQEVVLNSILKSI